jgi:hypothetical protein
MFSNRALSQPSLFASNVEITTVAAIRDPETNRATINIRLRKLGIRVIVTPSLEMERYYR